MKKNGKDNKDEKKAGRPEKVYQQKDIDHRQTRMNTIVISLMVLLSAVLLVATVLIYQNYLTELRDQASTKADLYTAETLRTLDAQIAEGISLSKQVANKLNGISSLNDVGVAIRSLRNDSAFENIAFCRFFADGKEYGQFATPYSLERENVSKLNGTNVARCAGLVPDLEWNTNTIAFYAPVASGAADGVVLYFPGDSFSAFTAQEDANDEFTSAAMVSVFASGEGETLGIFHKDENVTLSVHNNIYDYLTNLVNDKAVIDALKNDLHYERSASYKVTVYSEDYVASIGTAKSGGGLSIVSLYSVEELCRGSYVLINSILGILIMVFAMLIFTGVFVLVTRRIAEQRRLTASLTDPLLNCPTRIKFVREAPKILAKNPNSNFAVIISEIRHFQYIQETFKNIKADEDCLKFLTLVFSKMMQVDEMFAYAGDGEFLLLLHYRDRDGLTRRLQTVSGLAYNHKGRLPDRMHLELEGGVYETSEGNYTDIEKMIENAEEARTSANVYESFSYKFFSESIRATHMQNSDIEMRMDSALANGEFVLVYQPKYNIRQDKPDGCEVLIRWFDPEKREYRSPALFMPLFEANGFVVKLDHYIFETVLKYINASIENGSVLYPVSVNVSRVTAAQPDFLDFYIKLKKQYNIRDHFITLEFTESVAYENYDMLKMMIDELHKNGFYCSIDDFGSGYSSYNILKELPMDEIKLDYFFIKKGIAADRDAAILQSIVSVAKKLGMKVTQEGVETRDELETLRKIGCDVIQGYHYSKPLMLSDYVQFISDNSRASGRYRNDIT